MPLKRFALPPLSIYCAVSYHSLPDCTLYLGHSKFANHSIASIIRQEPHHECANLTFFVSTSRHFVNKNSMRLGKGGVIPTDILQGADKVLYMPPFSTTQNIFKTPYVFAGVCGRLLSTLTSWNQRLHHLPSSPY